MQNNKNTEIDLDTKQYRNVTKINYESIKTKIRCWAKRQRL